MLSYHKAYKLVDRCAAENVVMNLKVTYVYFSELKITSLS